MSITAARRHFGFLVAMAVAALPILAQPLPAAAAATPATGTLFAITSSQNLVKVDPAAGTFNTVALLNTPDSPQSNALASDPASHRLFAVRTTMTGVTWPPIVTQNLLTIDSRSGAILSSPQFTGLAPQSLAFDTSSGTLFGFTGLAIVRVDPATASTTSVATIATTFGPFIYSLALDTPSHTIYLAQEDVSGSIATNSTHILSMSTQGGAVSTGPTLARTVRQIAVDSGHLFGITDCCSFDFVAINNITGATTTLASVPGAIIQFGTATDTASHTVFVDIENQDTPGSWTYTDHIVAINDQTGASSLGAGLADNVVGLGLVFVPNPAITPESIKADVRSARASGAIDNPRLANALLAILDAAAYARSKGKCSTAAHIYTAFVYVVSAQSSKHIAAATATQLVSEAQFLIANCP